MLQCGSNFKKIQVLFLFHNHVNAIIYSNLLPSADDSLVIFYIMIECGKST